MNCASLPDLLRLAIVQIVQGRPSQQIDMPNQSMLSILMCEEHFPIFRGSRVDAENAVYTTQVWEAPKILD